jgi:cyclic pyranopterin monophosphate synthase
MKSKQLSHISTKGQPQMVDVSDKSITKRMAKAQAIVSVNKDIADLLRDGDLHSKKGPVFQTAIIAGVMAAKRTHELIPMCHPLGLEDCQIKIELKGLKVFIESTCTITGKTGVEMEALTAATVAALTVYDMCKALSHEIIIEQVSLQEKTGGKSTFKRVSKSNHST